MSDLNGDNAVRTRTDPRHLLILIEIAPMIVRRPELPD
jgi:hypothetical protein